MNTENRHISVLLNESIEAFSNIAAGGVIVDCTLGGAGHTRALLERYPQARVLGCDLDINAIEAARKSLAHFVSAGRLEFYHGSFASLIDAESLPEGFRPPWMGILMDLGYSSNQLESEEYGMSFSLDAPIDMRLSRPPKGETAWQLMIESTAQELGDILKAYGEMQGAHRLARRIREGVESGRIENSTASLADFVDKASGKRKKDAIHPATLVFQALRIAVNDELRALDHFLEGAIPKLSKSGHIAVISFHSLEDGIVKGWGKKHATRLRAMTKKPVMAQQDELKLNPRARSAKLRVYEVV